MTERPRSFYDPVVLIGCLLVALALVGMKAGQYRNERNTAEIDLEITENRLEIYDQYLKEAQRRVAQLEAEIESLKSGDEAVQ